MGINMPMRTNLNNSQLNFKEQTNRFINGDKESIQRIHDNLTDYNLYFDLKAKNKSHLNDKLNTEKIIELSLEIYNQIIANSNRINEGIIHPLTLLNITDDNEFMEKICDFANDFNNSFEKMYKNNLEIENHISSINYNRTDSLFDKSSNENKESSEFKSEISQHLNKSKIDDQVTVNSILNQINHKLINSTEINTNTNYTGKDNGKKNVKRNSIQSLLYNPSNQNSEYKNNYNFNNKFIYNTMENDKISYKKTPSKTKPLFNQNDKSVSNEILKKQSLKSEIKSPMKKSVKNKSKYNFKIQIIQTNPNSIINNTNQTTELKTNNLNKTKKIKSQNINTIIKNDNKKISKKNKNKNIQIKIDLRNISNSKNELKEAQIINEENKVKKNTNENFGITFNVNEKSHFIKSESNTNNKNIETINHNINTNENIQNKINNKTSNNANRKFSEPFLSNIIYQFNDFNNDKYKKLKNDNQNILSPFQLDNIYINNIDKNEQINSDLYEEIMNQLKIPEYKVDLEPLSKNNSNLNLALFDYKNKNKFLFETTEEEKKLNDQIKLINKNLGNQ